jgi:hypothetical protein
MCALRTEGYASVPCVLWEVQCLMYDVCRVSYVQRVVCRVYCLSAVHFCMCAMCVPFVCRVYRMLGICHVYFCVLCHVCAPRVCCSFCVMRYCVFYVLLMCRVSLLVLCCVCAACFV